MKTVNYEKEIPKESIIKDQDFHVTDYEDSISILIPSHPNNTVDNITKAFFTYQPGWVLWLLNLRNIIVKPFGLRTGKTLNPDERYETGEPALPFKIIKRSENELVMAEDDKHLNFRTSVLILPSEKPGFVKLYSITIVKYNNLLGKLYFIPVKPFHKLIIKASLKKIKKT
jgi:hypothetical protein